MATTQMEWAVRWFVDPQPTYEIEPVMSEEEAEHLVSLYPTWNGEVVSRIVSYGEWLPSPGKEA